MTRFEFDILVVGGGHAGVEAALAAARLGARAALVTHDVLEIGRMPCNPAIGGLGKGHLVREIDVLGGEMGSAIDESGLQFRLLNTKKGPAVQSPRAQADKHVYQKRMSEVCQSQPGLTVVAGDVAGLIVEESETSRRTTGVRLSSGREVSAPRVVLCTGTFMKGLMHVGDARTVGGREGADSCEGLSGSLADYGFELRRLKTGTPPRLLSQTIDYSQLNVQAGDPEPTPFSFRTRNFAPDQINCYQAYTNQGTHDIIAGSLGRSPLFGGAIAGQGPRYCPSIEDKVVRFADRDRHLLFLEPEGRETDEVYVNGLSTSLPSDVQEMVVHSIPGLEEATILRYGYAVEYDSIPSWQIDRHFECKSLRGLYLAGQILGTSGYEEAAAQGLVAGVNAVRSLDNGAPLVLGRDQAYIGVLADDLVTKDISEPYRMFTSRAEHRMHLRCDNAEERLLPFAREIGLLSGPDLDLLAAREDYVAAAKHLLDATRVEVRASGARLRAAEYLRYPGVTLAGLAESVTEAGAFASELGRLGGRLGELNADDAFIARINFQIENDIKYAGYIAKQKKLLNHRNHLDFLELPADMDYGQLHGLSTEAREKLARVRPVNLGQADRIDGVRAADLAVLTVYLRKRNRGANSGADE